MITLDYSPFANTSDSYFDSLNDTHRYVELELENAIFDEIKMDESLDIPCTDDMKQWDYDTVFLAHFKDTLEAGNLELDGVPINNLKLKRRKKDSLQFEDIHIFDYDPEVDNYEYIDRFVESYDDYVYGLQPMGGSVESPVLGETITAEVETEFDSVWLVGKDQQYELKYNLEVGSYETNIPTGVHTTLGSKYPVISQGNAKYRSGKVKCMILSDTTVSTGKINPKEEKKIRRAIEKFVFDGKPKYYKDGSGEAMVVSIINTFSLSPNNDLGQLVYEADIDLIEIADSNLQSLIDTGLLEV